MKRESLIDKFFENSLSEKESIEFDKLMQSDETFKNEVDFRKELKEVITINDRRDIKQELRSYESVSGGNKFKLWSAAASVILIFGVVGFWWFSNSTINSNELFNSYFEPYRNTEQPIVRGEQDESLRFKAFMAYEQQNYKLALDYFNQLLDEESNPTISFYKANALLQLNNIDEATIIFEEHLKKTDTLNEKTHWYLALAYIKIGNLEGAKEQLDLLVNSPNSEYKKEEAKKLLKQLK